MRSVLRFTAVLPPFFMRPSRPSGNPGPPDRRLAWMPAFAGMTIEWGTRLRRCACNDNKGSMLFTITAARTEADLETVRRLFRAYAESLPFSLDFQGFAAELAGLPMPYAPPNGCLLLARRDGEAIGVVGLKPLAPGIAEIKRLYVVPDARRLGLGKQLAN